MTYVGKNLPAWVRFRPRAPVRERYGPPTMLEWIIEQTARHGIGRLIDRVTAAPSPTMGSISRQRAPFWNNGGAG